MASLNKVILLGNLTRDPEVKYLPSGTAVADLRMAVSRKFKTQQGEDKEETCFISVEAWGRQAETCGEYLSKGSSLLVEGRLKYEEWEKDGKRNSRIKVVAERTQFVGPRRSKDNEAGGGAPAGNSGGNEAAQSAAPAGDSGGSEATQSADPSPAPEAPGDDDDLPF